MMEIIHVKNKASGGRRMCTNEDYLVICLAVQAHSYPDAIGLTADSRVGSGGGGGGGSQQLLCLPSPPRAASRGTAPIVKECYATDILWC